MTLPLRIGLLSAAFGLTLAACSPSAEGDKRAEAAPPTPVVLGSGDAEAGRRAFGRCRSCHAIEAGVNRVGPSLRGVVGRPAGAVADYAYSKPMKASGLVWTDATLEAYLENPRTHVPGTKMSFAGVADPQERRDLVAYLKTLS